MIDDMLANASSVVKKAEAAGADSAEAFLVAGEGLDVEVESGQLSGSSRSASSGGCVRIIKDKRIGFAYFTRLDDAPRAISQALELSKLGAAEAMQFPDRDTYQAIPDNWVDEVAKLDAELAVREAKDLIAGLDIEATLSGGVSLNWGAHAIANSNDVAAAGQATMVQAYASLVKAEGATNINAWDATSAHGLLDCQAITKSVSETVTKLRGAKPATEGVGDVIMLPSAGSELVTGVVLGAVDGDSAKRGKSFWSNKLGEVVAHPGLSIKDTPLDPNAISGTSHDDEGRAVQDIPIIDCGSLNTFLFNSRDGGKHDEPPTGHAVRDGFKSPPGTGAHHVVVESKNTISLDELIGGVDAGYLVESVLGAHTANGTTGDFSVTAPNVWRIENGAIAHPCKEVAIGGNLPELLMNLDGVSDQPKVSAGSRIPAMRFRDVQVSA